jgi:hypothetical protein
MELSFLLILEQLVVQLLEIRTVRRFTTLHQTFSAVVPVLLLIVTMSLVIQLS